MLIKITNSCHAGCSHCLENSVPGGPHMTWETFLKALDFSRRLEGLIWSHGYPPLILISGGECTEHPDVVTFVEEVYRQKLVPTLITNGMWLSDPVMRKSLLRPEWSSLYVQVTNDPRFYPNAAPVWDDPRITFVSELNGLLPLGRAAHKKDIDKRGVAWKRAPTSFNLRSATRSLRSIEKAITMLRLRSTVSLTGLCIPSIADNGDVMAGESRFCWKIGTVDSTNEELTQALLEMGSCNRCGLEANLTQPEKRAIGISTLFAGIES